MKNITITQKYALCMLKEMKKLRNGELSPHLIVSMIIEMRIEGCLEIINNNEGKKFESLRRYTVRLNNKQPVNEYNRKLYRYIEEMNKEEIEIDSIIKSTCYGFSDKKLKDITESLKKEMVANELISLQEKKGILGKKEVILIDNNKFTQTIEEVRTKVLAEEQLTEDMVLLISLLNATYFLKNIFIKYEKENLKKRLKELEDNLIFKQVKIARLVISDMTDVYV